MLDLLNQWDAWLFTAINSHHSPFFDCYFWIVTNRFTWVVMYMALAYLLLRHDWRRGLAVIAVVGLVVLLADQLSSSVIKVLVERPRPSHEPTLTAVHLVNGYAGGPYGFVSSHAANMIGVALTLSLAFRYRLFTVAALLWTAIVCYSRIYLGVHYPGDILGGLVVGGAAAAMLWWAFSRIAPRLRIAPFTQRHQQAKKAAIVIIAYNLSVVIVAILALAFLWFPFLKEAAA